MPYFIQKNVEGAQGIAYHGHDIVDQNSREYSKHAHDYVQQLATMRDEIYLEMADDMGEPCTLFSNTIAPEGNLSRLEFRG